MPNKHILIITSWYPDKDREITTRTHAIHDFARYWAKLGHRVFVVVPDFRIDGEFKCSEFDGVKIFFLPLQFPFGKPSGKYSFFVELLRTFWIVLRHDIFHKKGNFRLRKNAKFLKYLEREFLKEKFEPAILVCHGCRNIHGSKLLGFSNVPTLITLHQNDWNRVEETEHLLKKIRRWQLHIVLMY